MSSKSVVRKKTKKTSFSANKQPAKKSRAKAGGNGIAKILVIILVLLAASILICNLMPPTGSYETPARQLSTDTLRGTDY